MLFREAMALAAKGQPVARLSWPENFHIMQANCDRPARPVYEDNCGRFYGFSASDYEADDWVIVEDQIDLTKGTNDAEVK